MLRTTVFKPYTVGVQGIFDKFSLPNILRQFFCGFVFIAPFWFFSGGNTTEDLAWQQLEGFLNGIHWELSRWIVLGVAACIIGTIIYHLEKNLYSYSMQAFFEGIDSCRNSSGEPPEKFNTLFCILLFGGVFSIILWRLEVFPHYSSHFCLYILMSFLLVAFLIIMVSYLIFLIISFSTFSPLLLALS